MCIPILGFRNFNSLIVFQKVYYLGFIVLFDKIFHNSSMVEHLTVNHLVIGSSPVCEDQNSSVGLECLIENQKVNGSNPFFDIFVIYFL